MDPVRRVPAGKSRRGSVIARRLAVGLYHQRRGR